MWIARTFRPFVVAAAAAACSPAWSQSYYHAPPGPNDAPLLPSINPARLFEPVTREAGLWPRRKQAAPRSQRSPQDAAHAERAASAVAPSAGPTTARTSEAPGPARFSPEQGVRPIAAPAQTRWVRIDESGHPIATSPSPTPRPVASSRPVALPESAAIAASTLPPLAPPAEPVAIGPPAAPPLTVPATPAAVRNLVARRLAEGNVADAEALLVEATERFAADPDLTLTLARLRESQEDWAGAADAYAAVLRLSPGETKWRLRRADCLYHAAEFAAAVADYEAAAAADPDALSPGEYTRFGDAALRTGDPATAEAAFTAISRTAEAPIARVELLRGLAALKQGDASRARDILLRASARWPRDRALTEALRLAAAIHYGDRDVVTAQVESEAAIDPVGEPIMTTAAEAAAPEPSEEEWHAPSRWRRSRDADPTTAGWRAARPIALADQETGMEPAPLP